MENDMKNMYRQSSLLSRHGELRSGLRGGANLQVFLQLMVL
jgi:hypothetical protein